MARVVDAHSAAVKRAGPQRLNRLAWGSTPDVFASSDAQSSGISRLRACRHHLVCQTQTRGSRRLRPARGARCTSSARTEVRGSENRSAGWQGRPASSAATIAIMFRTIRRGHNLRTGGLRRLPHSRQRDHIGGHGQGRGRKSRQRKEANRVEADVCDLSQSSRTFARSQSRHMYIARRRGQVVTPDQRP